MIHHHQQLVTAEELDAWEPIDGQAGNVEHGTQSSDWRCIGGLGAVVGGSSFAAHAFWPFVPQRRGS